MVMIMIYCHEPTYTNAQLESAAQLPYDKARVFEMQLGNEALSSSRMCAALAVVECPEGPCLREHRRDREMAMPSEHSVVLDI